MSAASPLAQAPLPSCAIVSASARVLLDRVIEEVLATAGPKAEVHRFFAKSYGRDEKGMLEGDVLRVLEGSSLFAPQRLVLLYDGATLLRAKAMKPWFASPTPRTSLVFVHCRKTRKDSVPKVPKGVAAVVVEQRGPESAAARRRWLQERAASQGCGLSAAAVELLEEMVGEGLDGLVAEVDKLCLYRLEGEISVEDVGALVGRSAGRDFDRLLGALQGRRLGDALSLRRAMESEGFVTFGGARIYGAGPTAGALVPILLSRLRRNAVIGAEGKQRDALIEALGVHPWYAKKLAEEWRRLGPRRAKAWLDGALAAEVVQKRMTHVRDPELLELLIAELARV